MKKTLVLICTALSLSESFRIRRDADASQNIIDESPMDYEKLMDYVESLGGIQISPALQGRSRNSNSWDYEHQIDWSNLYPTCGGFRQSPIDIKIETAIDADKPSCLHWTNYDMEHDFLTLENNGHTIETSSTWKVGRHPAIFGGPLNSTYMFGKIHWHWGSDFRHGSEHIINGKLLPIEMHIIHYNIKFRSLDEAIASGESEALAVVGILFKLSTISNPAMTIITRAMQEAENEGVQNIALPLNEFGFERLNHYFSYVGSLTTPPCHQIVRWIVMEDPLDITIEQLLVFRSIMVEGHPMINNYRLTQPLNDRKIYYYSKCNIK